MGRLKGCGLGLEYLYLQVFEFGLIYHLSSGPPPMYMSTLVLSSISQ